MARSRTRKDPTIEIIMLFAGLLTALVFFNPSLRPLLGATSTVAIVGIVAAVVLLLCVLIIKLWKRRQADQLFDTAAPPAPNTLLPIIHRLNSITPATAPSKKPCDALTTAQLVEKLRNIDWFQFEKIVALIYRNLGYSVSRRGGANPDGGIDLLIRKDGQTSAIQCKQWKSWNVDVKAVREFLGALTHAEIKQGVFVTLGGYTEDARQLAHQHGIEMLNETDLARMLDSVAARFDPQVMALLNDTQKFCPKCEKDMVLRTAAKGLGAGKQFWGCSTYPRCKFTMPV